MFKIRPVKKEKIENSWGFIDSNFSAVFSLLSANFGEDVFSFSTDLDWIFEMGNFYFSLLRFDICSIRITVALTNLIRFVS